MRKDSPVVEPLGTPVQDSEVVTPASIAVLVVLHVNGALVEDPKVIVAAVRLVPAVPVLLKLSTQVLVLDEQLADPDTLAVDVNDPNRPNTNPAIAMAAMSVIAMSMTVAMTGEMAFLPLTFVICMLLRPPRPLK